MEERIGQVCVESEKREGIGGENGKKVGKKSVKKKEEKIGDALLKVALGYQIAEVTEEYAEVNGELKLTKRKKTKKDVPPDLKAVQILLSSGEAGDYSGWTDEALQAEKARLLAELKEQADEVTTDVKKGKASAVEEGTSKKKAERSVTKKKVKRVAKKVKSNKEE